jgi:hypothetical protein
VGPAGQPLLFPDLFPFSLRLPRDGVVGAGRRRPPMADALTSLAGWAPRALGTDAGDRRRPSTSKP